MTTTIPVELPAWLYVVTAAAIILALAALIMAIGAHVILAGFRDQVEQASDDSDHAVRLAWKITHQLTEASPLPPTEPMPVPELAAGLRTRRPTPHVRPAVDEEFERMLAEHEAAWRATLAVLDAETPG